MVCSARGSLPCKALTAMCVVPTSTKKTVKAKGKPKKKAAPKSKGSTEGSKAQGREAETKIATYMKEQNRPYSAQNVFDNLHGVVPKAQVQNLMEKLSKEPGSEGEPPLVMKEYGAQKVFLCNQSLFGDCSPESVLQLNADVAEVEKKLPSVRAALGKVTAEISQLRSQGELEGRVVSSRKRVRELEERVHGIRKEREKAGVSDLGQKLAEAQTKYGDLHNTLAKRRRLVLDAAQLLVVYDATVAHLSACRLCQGTAQVFLNLNSPVLLEEVGSVSADFMQASGPGQPLFNTWKPVVTKRPSLLGAPPLQPLQQAQIEAATVKQAPPADGLETKSERTVAKQNDDDAAEKRERAIISSMEKAKLTDVPRRSFLGHDHFFKYRRRSSNSQTNLDTEEDVHELRKKATSLRYRLAMLRLKKEQDERVIGNLLDFLTASKDGQLLVDELRRKGRIVCC
ncbi:PSMC3 interacting protein [Perkinsus olseni]|uniref:PSMC3 interacting protein n=1 Tax=Perkinsus olseni TaxID=32597 RepID=A0A7J6NL55_PEROL|nr:PSMC3 interacting protein [Perkinsus olseni]